MRKRTIYADLTLVRKVIQLNGTPMQKAAFKALQVYVHDAEDKKRKLIVCKKRIDKIEKAHYLRQRDLYAKLYNRIAEIYKEDIERKANAGLRLEEKQSW